MKQPKKPALRFKGFVNDWEQRKLGECCQEFKSGSFISASDIGDVGKYPVYGGNGLRGFSAEYNHDGEFALIGRQGALCGNMNYSVGRAYFTEHAIAVQANKTADTKFLYYLLRKMNLGQYSDQSAQPGLAVGKLVKLTDLFPSVAEQIKIGHQFMGIDNLITLHQRKLEKLQNLEKAMLEKMFPKNGAKVPEIRFKGFTDDWEQRKLGECCREFKSGSFISASDIGDVGKYPVYGGNGLRGFSAEYNHDGEFALIGRQGALCGNMNYSVGRAYFTEHAIAVQANKTADTKFLYYLLRKMNLGQYSDQSAQPGLAVGKLVKLTDLFPSVAEQIKIGHQFMGIDNLITLHQRKLEKLQNLKKAMLERMFI